MQASPRFLTAGSHSSAQSLWLLGLLAHDLDAVALFCEPEENAARGLGIAVDLVGERRHAHRRFAFAPVAPKHLEKRNAREKVVAALVAVGKAADVRSGIVAVTAAPPKTMSQET